MIKCHCWGKGVFNSIYQGGRTRLHKFKFLAKFPIGLHMILEPQIKKFKSCLNQMLKIILNENPSGCSLAPLFKWSLFSNNTAIHTLLTVDLPRFRSVSQVSARIGTTALNLKQLLTKYWFFYEIATNGTYSQKIVILRVESLFVRTDRDCLVWCKF